MKTPLKPGTKPAGKPGAEPAVKPGADPAVKPAGRGVSHQIAFFGSLITGINLILQCRTLREQVGAAIFAASISTLFGVSALYHRVNWSRVARERMRRFDHASIYLLISGTYTPIMLLALQETAGMNILALVWGATALGIFLEFAVPRAPKWLKACIYVALGWVAVFMAPQIIASLGHIGFGMILTGGLLYTLGALIYALKKPNPWPRYFGYHEIFHLLVIAGAAVHYYVVAVLILK